jgi:hypothetical protein
MSRTLKDLESLEKGSPAAFGEALFEEVKAVEVPECKANAPVESGTMRDEIHVEGPFFRGNRVSVQVQTGPKSADYALIQHEDMELIHEVGGPKFIERPMKEASKHLPNRVAKRIDLTKVL